jgi:uncharacterized protein (DUF1697 family)
MPKYFAFLRAINVGGHTVKMDDLRSLFEELGFSNVETFIASGNVIFDSSSRSSKALEKKIETALQESLGYEVRTFVRSLNELADIAAHQPFPPKEMNAAGHTVYVGFMADSPSEAAKQKLLSLATEVDDFHLNGREVYWLSRTKFSDSTISGAVLEKTLVLPATLRNSNTIRRLVAKYC